MEAHGQCERDFVSRKQFSRLTSRFLSDQCTQQPSRGAPVVKTEKRGPMDIHVWKQMGIQYKLWN
jgi:hypothetical protein